VGKEVRRWESLEYKDSKKVLSQVSDMKVALHARLI
jgi:hypothetical protein